MPKRLDSRQRKQTISTTLSLDVVERLEWLIDTNGYNSRSGAIEQLVIAESNARGFSGDSE